MGKNDKLWLRAAINSILVTFLRLPQSCTWIVRVLCFKVYLETLLAVLLKSHTVHSYYTTKKIVSCWAYFKIPYSHLHIYISRERGDVSNFFYLKYWDTKHTFKVLLYIAHKIFWIYWTIAGPKNLTNFQYTKFKTDLTRYLLQILIMLCEYIKRIFYAKMPQKLCVWDLLSEFPLEVKCRSSLSVNYYLKRCCYVII